MNTPLDKAISYAKSSMEKWPELNITFRKPFFLRGLVEVADKSRRSAVETILADCFMAGYLAAIEHPQERP